MIITLNTHNFCPNSPQFYHFMVKNAMVCLFSLLASLMMLALPCFNLCCQGMLTYSLTHPSVGFRSILVLIVVSQPKPVDILWPGMPWFACFLCLSPLCCSLCFALIWNAKEYWLTLSKHCSVGSRSILVLKRFAAKASGHFMTTSWFVSCFCCFSPWCCFALL